MTEEPACSGERIPTARSTGPDSDEVCTANQNRVVISGRLENRDTLRYTPAGVPVVSAGMLHVSEQAQGEGIRRVECPVGLVVIGEPALRFDRLALGTGIKVAGFLATRHRNSSALVVNVIDFRQIQII